jgi:hypothetical protein
MALPSEKQHPPTGIVEDFPQVVKWSPDQAKMEIARA